MRGNMFQKVFLQIKEKISLPMLVLIAAGLLNFYYVLRYSVNMPHRAEWDYLFVFPPEGSVFHAGRTSRPVLANAAADVFYLLNGWNITFHLIFNYFVYTADIVLLYRLIVKAAGEYRFLPLFFLPLFSDLNALNLTQTTALQFHFSVLFGLIAADIGFCRPPTYHNSLKFIFFAALSVLSMNPVFILGILIGWIVMEARRKNFARILGVFFFMIVIFQVCGGGLSVFAGKQILRPAVILFSAVLTGLDMVTPLHIILIFPVVAALGYAFYQRRLWEDCGALLLFSIILAAFLSALNGEQNEDPFVFIHSGAGIVLFAVPVVFTLLRLVKPVFIYLCCLGVIGYSAAFSPTYLKAEAAARRQTLECALKYYDGAGDGVCPNVDKHHSASFLDVSVQLGLSFTRRK